MSYGRGRTRGVKSEIQCTTGCFVYVVVCCLLQVVCCHDRSCLLILISLL